MKARDFFRSLIGLDIKDAIDKLGYWWRLHNVHRNPSVGFYTFERAAGGHLELRTDNKNIVTNEFHNDLAELQQNRDLK